MLEFQISFFLFMLCNAYAYGISEGLHAAELILGQEMNAYFKNFDLIFGDAKNRPIERETAHFSTHTNPTSNNITELETIGSQGLSPNLEIQNLKHGRNYDVDKNIVQLVFIITLKDLKSLEAYIDQIRILFSNTKFPTSHPYYFISWEHPLSKVEQDEILIQGNKLSRDFPIDSDVYFTFLNCQEIKTSGNTKNTTDKEPPYSAFSKNFETTECPSGLAVLKIFEFYTAKDRGFIAEVKFQVGEKWEWTISQKVIRRRDFGKIKLSTVAAYGYEYRAKFDSNNSSYVSGYEADQVHFLGDSFNMSVQAAVGTGWINLNADKKLTGMGAQIINGEADISISASEVLPYRAMQLSFLHPTYYTKLWSFFVQPPSSSFRDIFIHAFTGDLWLTMFSTWILIIMAMGSLAVVKRRLDTMHENDTVIIQELFIWAAGAVCQQGWHTCPESTCMKIIFIFALITGLVSYVAYSAALVSILSVKVVPIKSLNDIVSRGYTIYQDNQTISAQYIIHKLEEERKIPYLALEQRSLRSETALPKILSLESPSAFVGAADFFYPVAKRNMSDTLICNSISRISVSGRPVRGGMFIKKGSPLKDFFNHRLLIMYERGIRFRLLENYFRESAVMCLEKTGATKDPLGFNDVYTAFVILLIGYCVSILILVIERIFPPRQYAVDGGGGCTGFCQRGTDTEPPIIANSIKNNLSPPHNNELYDVQF